MKDPRDMALQINSLSSYYELRRFGEDEKCRAKAHSLSLSPKMGSSAFAWPELLLCTTAPSEPPNTVYTVYTVSV